MQALKEGSQSSRILGHLAHGRRLTPLEALKLFGCLRLGARIYALKRRGHKIGRDMVSLDNGKTVASYYLRGSRR